MKRALRAFGRFWWEFLVGDTPEFVVATAVVVAVALGLRGDNGARIILLPVLTLGAVAASAALARRR